MTPPVPRLAPEAVELYQAMLTDRTLGPGELGLRLGMSQDEVNLAMDDLAEAALLRRGESDPQIVTPAHPRMGFAQLVAQAEADLAERSRTVATFKSLADLLALQYDAHQHHEALVHHPTMEGVRARLTELAEKAKVECVSLNPGRAHRPDSMAAAKPLNQQALERGVGIRAVYQDSFRHDPGTLANANWMAEHGGQTRTLPVVPLLMIIVDAEVALLPRVVGDPSQGAVEIASPAVVTALMHYFETMWTIAEPFGDVNHRRREVTSATTHELLQILAAGATDEAAARRLGLSTRTVRRLMSDYMTAVNARSRFQAGVEAQRQGQIG